MVSPDLVGAAATCVTIFMFLCPASAILRIHKAKSLPDDFNLYPYSFTALLATLWWYYGVIVEVKLIYIAIQQLFFLLYLNNI